MFKAKTVENQYLKKSKSLCSLQNNENAPNDRKGFRYARPISRTISESSVDICVINDTSDSDDAVDEQNKALLVDSGIVDKSEVFEGEMIVCLEQKIDRLSDMFLEQCRLLTTLKEEIRNSKVTMEKTEHTHNQLLTGLLKKAISQRVKDLSVAESSGPIEEKTWNSRAKTLLNAIESRQGMSLDGEIKDALVSILQSDELKQQMVHTTAESVKDIIGECFARDFSALYLPILERSHRRLVRHITKVIEQAFVELEENSATLSKSVYKTSKTLRRALERHQSLMEAASDPEKNLINSLQCAVEELLHKELKQWRQKVLDMFSVQLSTEPLIGRSDLPKTMVSSNYVSVSPPQPTGPEHSIIDQLMKSAEIKKQICEGDVNGPFERALSASDLSLVMAACRAADPAHVFGPPCRLKQHVLLSLVQQLATDMVHDTQLKCSYLEDAIINLNPAYPDTRTHLPLIVGEVRKHLSKFLKTYPNHVATRRIAFIVMAVDNLIK